MMVIPRSLSCWKMAMISTLVRLSRLPVGSSASSISGALINEPEMLLADEPTGNLDSRTSVEIMAIFQQLNERGITIIMVTHEQDIAGYAQRNVMMRDGVIVDDHLVSRRSNAVSVVE